MIVCKCPTLIVLFGGRRVTCEQTHSTPSFDLQLGAVLWEGKKKLFRGKGGKQFHRTASPHNGRLKLFHRSFKYSLVDSADDSFHKLSFNKAKLLTARVQPGQTSATWSLSGSSPPCYVSQKDTTEWLPVPPAVLSALCQDKHRLAG